MGAFRSLIIAALVVSATAQILAPADDILSPPSGSAVDPLKWATSNSPWFAGPSVFNISSTVPEGCTVQQAVYVVRHGSRFPDGGAYNGWVTLYQKIQAAVQAGNLTATGSLSFIPGWKPVLTNPNLQKSQETLTGYKEASDLGYQLRVRYPHFYQDGNPFYVWANQYSFPINSSRVVQTAKAFIRGYLYVFADLFGTVVSVNSTATPAAIGDSLGPSDSCPLFGSTSSGGNNASDWNSVWVPPVLARVNALVSGITFTAGDLMQMPYLCGFESQITGRLSPWCGVLNNQELKYNEYLQDLNYFYQVGPGSVGPAKNVFLPFLDSLMSLLAQGPGQKGKGPDGTPFTVPNLIMAFLNDNQIAEMTAAMGIFDSEGLLPTDHIPENYIYNVAHFISMRGTVTFEVLNCTGSSSPTTTSAPATSTTASVIAPNCNHDNCLRQFIQNEASVSNFCATYTTSTSTATASLPTYVSQCASSPSRISSACSCIVTPTPTPTPSPAPGKPNTYIRILLNDAVYPVDSCQNGPGSSCLLSEYASFIHAKHEAAGDFIEYCNVNRAGAPANVTNGARFFTDLTLDFLTMVKP